MGADDGSENRTCGAAFLSPQSIERAELHTLSEALPYAVSATGRVRIPSATWTRLRPPCLAA